MQTQIDDKLELLALTIYSSAEADSPSKAREFALEEYEQMSKLKRYIAILEEDYDDLDALKESVYGV